MIKDAYFSTTCDTVFALVDDEFDIKYPYTFSIYDTPQQDINELVVFERDTECLLDLCGCLDADV